ncbi:MAG: hypothetical protein HONBIEJF_03020 [Fimbriimonadaceae bacterium]|nr:hypothetical protein [Fimbriimonadaceae bacterium]
MPKGEYLQYGGQAVVEGVMMRSPRYFAVACRAPNGKIILTTESIEKTWIGRQKWLKLPFLRGTLALLDSMALGYKALKFSSDIQIDPVHAPVKEGEEAAGKATPEISKTAANIQVGAAMFFGLAFGLFLFNYLPNLISEWMGPANQYAKNFLAEMVKIVLFLGYIWGISFIPDIFRIFQYHGAEHKAINTMEADQDLTMENTMRQTRLHPRCGTSFAIVVLIVSMLLFTFLPRYPLGESTNKIFNVTVRFFMEIAILPIVSGISYELIRFAGRMRNSSFVQALFWPGLMTQYITTKPPAEEHAEVALVALRSVVHAEETGELLKEADVVSDLPTHSVAVNQASQIAT